MPTIDEVSDSVKKFDNDSEPYEWLVKELFQKYPRDTNSDQVLLKTMVLNKIYSAGVIAEYAVARHIKGLADIDSLMAAGSDDSVRLIANVEIGERKICFISFATKYCNWHNPPAYPIFDKMVRACLLFHKKLDGFAKFTLDSLWNYPTFRKVVNEFRSFYGLQAEDAR